MVFQKPNPFPKSIYDNIVYGPKLNGVKKKSQLDDIVERSLEGRPVGRGEGSAEELGAGPLGRSAAAPVHRPGDRRRARRDLDGRAVLGARPDRDRAHRGSDARAEERYTIIIVTHNMQQAARVSDRTAFFSVEVNPESDRRTGVLVEYDRTEKMFSNPSDERTENYVTGRFG